MSNDHVNPHVLTERSYGNVFFLLKWAKLQGKLHDYCVERSVLDLLFKQLPEDMRDEVEDWIYNCEDHITVNENA